MIKVITVLVGQDEKLSEPLVFETDLERNKITSLFFETEHYVRENIPEWSVDDITERFYQHDDIEKVEFEEIRGYLI